MSKTKNPSTHVTNLIIKNVSNNIPKLIFFFLLLNIVKIIVKTRAL